MTRTSFQDDFDREVERQARESRPCTCHPDDKPPVPCAKKYAYSECIKSSVPTQIAPASDKLIESLERALTERDISTAYSDHVLSLIARIKAVREQTIFECAEIARTWAQDNETIQPSYNGITNAILALLTNKGEQQP